VKSIVRLLSFASLAAVLVVGGHLYYLSTLAATEQYPEDTYFDSETNKVALIIVAHDDDAITNAGTITMLTRKGWKIREMCFFQQGGLYFKKDSARNPIRKRSLQQVSVIQGLQGVDPIDFNFRKDMMTPASYMPMPYDAFPSNYEIDSLEGYISGYIEKYQPSVIFTLDNVIGGYGHPDHVLMSQLVLGYCRTHKNDSNFYVKKIYQSVFTPSLSESIMADNNTYIEAKKVYQCNGMPAPDVQINFYEYASEKKEAMAAYTTEQNSLRKIWPFYNWYPASIYFKIFDRDFFRVVEVSKIQ
jgi:LmbE family N-acetylglucosaminyl deacetylase